MTSRRALTRKVRLILLDFSKAFDKVDHNLLISKVNNAGIHGPLLSWLISFQNQRLQHVVVDGCISDPNPVLSGSRSALVPKLHQ